MKVSTQIAFCTLLLASNLTAQSNSFPFESTAITRFFDLKDTSLTVSFFEDMGLIEVCFDNLTLHPEMTHHLVIPEGRFVNEIVTDAPTAAHCLYFKMAYANDLVTLLENSQVTVTLLESTRQQ